MFPVLLLTMLYYVIPFILCLFIGIKENDELFKKSAPLFGVNLILSAYYVSER